ncbi:hypothetical protein J4N45_09820 [Vibrio sp. SCSIO 43140]|uniref:hypothetical protein n=1 Tax=Vibrio sp. SCSIO 43140 TaxID=2819100 RepID=UPI00207612F3|nr:hypothetical protein [Vibrio sp. SCSIO 43140]USD58825.1 hypothetical protein J4N45_09820 [Vibrio sp. SCSIO 43140]
MNCIKVLLTVVAVIKVVQISAGGKGGAMCFFAFTVALFMTGAEMSTDTDTPWQFLILEATLDDLLIAGVGGFGMLALFAIFVLVVGKDIQDLFEISDNKSRKTHV